MVEGIPDVLMKYIETNILANEAISKYWQYVLKNNIGEIPNSIYYTIYYDIPNVLKFEIYKLLNVGNFDLVAKSSNYFILKFNGNLV